MGNYDYNFTVDNFTITPNTKTNAWTSKDFSNPTISTGTMYTNTVSCTSSGCACHGWHYYYPNYGWWWYPTEPVTKYLYQILCPKPGCAGKFWAEIDEIKACPKCKSKIKVTDKESDYEVAVNK
jgi:hypothetical protein